MPHIEILSETIHNATGLTGKKLENQVFAVACVMSEITGNTEALKHFEKRFNETKD